jgi:hypothetical protein
MTPIEDLCWTVRARISTLAAAQEFDYLGQLLAGLCDEAAKNVFAGFVAERRGLGLPAKRLVDEITAAIRGVVRVNPLLATNLHRLYLGEGNRPKQPVDVQLTLPEDRAGDPHFQMALIAGE